MPLVLATAEGADRNGYRYDDRTGVSYEYPNIYAKLVETGAQFVYHMPKRGYTGAGIIGEVVASERPNHWVAKIEDYVEFPTNVPLKPPGGVYYEAKGDVGVYWSQGVRPLSETAFRAIVSAVPDLSPTTKIATAGGGGGYASPETAAAVEAYSVAVVMGWLADKYAGSPIREMPHSNPGFDILVGPDHDPELYVEVKGTQAGESVFWMSEGERQFSVKNDAKYLLVVVSGINLKEQDAHTLRHHQGAVAGQAFALEASQWRGVLL